METKKLNLTFMTDSGSTFMLEVKSTRSIYALKQLLYSKVHFTNQYHLKTNIPPQMMLLYHYNTLLSNDKMIQSYNIGDNDMLRIQINQQAQQPN